MSEIGKPFLKKSVKKNYKKKQKNLCQNAACEQKTNNEKWKFGSNDKVGLD